MIWSWQIRGDSQPFRLVSCQQTLSFRTFVSASANNKSGQRSSKLFHVGKNSRSLLQNFRTQLTPLCHLNFTISYREKILRKGLIANAFKLQTEYRLAYELKIKVTSSTNLNSFDFSDFYDSSLERNYLK